MYCSSCGVAVAQSLSFCNYCGAKLTEAKSDSSDKVPEVRPELLVSAMVAVFILGLAAITVLMGVMKNVLDLPSDRILAFTLVPFLIMLLLEVVFLRLLFRRKRSRAKAGSNVRLNGQATRELDGGQARTLAEPVPSVTEHTTRVLDPIYNDRNSK